MTAIRAFLWVQTRLGLGHLSRAVNLATALARDGFEVTLAHGGLPAAAISIPGSVRHVQLPPAQSPDLQSGEILDANDAPITEAWRQARCQALAAAIDQTAPDLIVTETFPLGRRIFAFEWLPILADLKQRAPKPLMAVSVRDIVTRPDKPGKAQALVDLANAHFDLVLCHGDPDIVKVTDEFPELERLAPPIAYAGYMVPAPAPAVARRSGVVVVAGSGAVGESLFRAALEARTQWTDKLGPWTIVTGPNFDPGFLPAPSPGLRIVGAVKDLPRRYAEARLVLAQGGYNTVLEVLSAKAPLVVSPFSTPKETEQTMRAARMAERGLLTYVAAMDLTGDTLARAMRTAFEAPRPLALPRIDQGERAAAILREAVVAHRSPATAP